MHYRMYENKYPKVNDLVYVSQNNIIKIYSVNMKKQKVLMLM